jgi:diguanylate cyclase (GGDEF)-like protein
LSASVLIIDDSAKIRAEIVRALKAADLIQTFREAGDGIAGFKLLNDERPDLIICDLEMPRMDGFKFLQLVDARQMLQDIPVIMLTGRGETELKVKGLAMGASDYVTKPFDRGELVARVKVQLKIKQLQDELKRSNERLREISNTDHLTGLYNRRYLMEVLAREMVRVQRKKSALSLVILDVDHFKKINDTYGHPGGDEVLQTVANEARFGLRLYDVAARYGGEEFVLVLPETPLTGGVAVAERLRKRVEAISLPPPLDQVAVTVSLGVASYPAQGVTDMETLLQQADLALFQAKRNGRNRVETMPATAGGKEAAPPQQET